MKLMLKILVILYFRRNITLTFIIKSRWLYEGNGYAIKWRRKRKTYSSNMSCTSCFDNEQKIDEINAENISNIIFQEKVL